MNDRPISIASLTSNCTLVAVKEVTGASDPEIIDVFLKMGWKPNSGANIYVYRKAVETLGFKTVEVDTVIKGRAFSVEYTDQWGFMNWKMNPARHLSLNTFIENHQKGVFVVSTRGHAFVVRDGRVVDPNVSAAHRRRRIHNAFEVIGAAPSHFVEKLEFPAGDPLVHFHYVSRRRPWTKSGQVERAARGLAHERGGTVRLSELAKVGYNRNFAEWDFDRDVLKIGNTTDK